MIFQWFHLRISLKNLKFRLNCFNKMNHVFRCQWQSSAVESTQASYGLRPWVDTSTFSDKCEIFSIYVGWLPVSYVRVVYRNSTIRILSIWFRLFLRLVQIPKKKKSCIQIRLLYTQPLRKYQIVTCKLQIWWDAPLQEIHPINETGKSCACFMHDNCNSFGLRKNFFVHQVKLT